MSRRCEYVRGGVWCGRTAKLRLGLSVVGHPIHWVRELCTEHADEYEQHVREHDLDGDIKVVRTEMEG